MSEIVLNLDKNHVISILSLIKLIKFDNIVYRILSFFRLKD